MSFILDTSVAIHLRDKDPIVMSKINLLGDVFMLSIISRVELEGGVYREPALAAQRRSRLDIMLLGMPVLDFDAGAGDAYRGIIEAVGYSRRKLLDRMIAAQALVLDATLVTMNGDDFRDIPGLKLLAW